MKNIIKLIISIAIPLIVGFLGSIFTSSSVTTWYTTINRPTFNPPNWIFMPVWTILFILIGLSFYLVWKKDFGKNKKTAIGIYAIQLILNLLWSLMFFGLESPIYGLITILILWIFIVANIISFFKITKTAGYLLFPYLAWVSFATILNAAILMLN